MTFFERHVFKTIKNSNTSFNTLISELIIYKNIKAERLCKRGTRSETANSEELENITITLIYKCP